MAKMATTYRLVDIDEVDGRDSTADRILAALRARADAREREWESLTAALKAPGLTIAESVGLLESAARAYESVREASDAFHAAVAAVGEI